MMKIPPLAKKPRYYVATSLNDAYSSWDTEDEALACIERFRISAMEDPHHYADYYARIIGVVRVCIGGKILL